MKLFSKIKESAKKSIEGVKKDISENREFKRKLDMQRKEVMREERLKQTKRLAREEIRARANQRLQSYKQNLSRPQQSIIGNSFGFGNGVSSKTQRIVKGKTKNSKTKPKRYDVLSGSLI